MKRQRRCPVPLLGALLLLRLAADAAPPPVTALAFCPDGSALVIGSQAGLEIRRWPGLDRAHRLETALSHVHDLRFDAKGALLAAAGGRPGVSGEVEIWRWPDKDASAGAVRLVYRSVEHEDLVHAVAWSPDSKLWVAAAYDRLATVHRTSDGERLREFRDHSRGVLAAAFLDDSRVVTGGIDHSLRLWDAVRGGRPRLLENHTAEVRALAVRPVVTADVSLTRTLVSVSRDRTVRFWQPSIGRLVRFARLESEPLAVEWSAGRAVVTAADGKLRVIDPETAEIVSERPAVDGPAYSLAVAPATRGEVAVGGERGQVVRVEIAIPKSKD